MTTTDTTPALDEIRRAGLEVLRCEIGLVGMVRFIRQFDQGSGDYTAERAKLQAGLTMDDVLAALEKVRAERERAPRPPPGRAELPTIAPDASEDEIRRAGLEALRRELGSTALVHFLRDLIAKSPDSAAERAKLAGHLSDEEVAAVIETRRAAEAEREQSS